IPTARTSERNIEKRIKDIGESRECFKRVRENEPRIARITRMVSDLLFRVFASDIYWPYPRVPRYPVSLGLDGDDDVGGRFHLHVVELAAGAEGANVLAGRGFVRRG